LLLFYISYFEPKKEYKINLGGADQPEVSKMQPTEEEINQGAADHQQLRF